MTETTTTPRTLVMERRFAHPIEKVWRAMSEPALLEQWLLKGDFKPVVGHTFEFRGEPTPHWDGIIPSEILAVEAPTRLSYRWYQFVVDLTLAPAEGGTLVRMEQSEFGPDMAAAYAGAKYGWNGFLGALDTLLARI